MASRTIRTVCKITGDVTRMRVSGRWASLKIERSQTWNDNPGGEARGSGSRRRGAEVTVNLRASACQGGTPQWSEQRQQRHQSSDGSCPCTDGAFLRRLGERWGHCQCGPGRAGQAVWKWTCCSPSGNVRKHQLRFKQTHQFHPANTFRQSSGGRQPITSPRFRPSQSREWKYVQLVALNTPR